MPHEPALTHFRAHRQGTLIADEVPGRVRYVADRRGRLVFPASGATLAAEDLTLFVPDETPDGVGELQLMLAAQELDPEDEACDRWRAYHGEPRLARWAACEVLGAKLNGAVVDHEAMNHPNPIAKAEPGLCRQLNADRVALGAACRRITGVEIAEPVAVGVDAWGIDVRARFGIVRLPFASESATEEQVAAAVGALLLRGLIVSGLVRPGGRPLREAHAHIAQHGRAMSMLRLGGCPTREACLETIAAASGQLAPGSWLLGVGIRTEGWPDPRWPTASELDAAAGDRPLCAWSFDHHALVLNSAGMRAVGIDSSTADPEHGRIARDDRARPTGLMLEAAAKLAWSRVPEPTPAQRREQVAAALSDLAGHGFTEVHDLLAPSWLGPLLADLHDAGALPMSRVLLYHKPDEFELSLASRQSWERPGVRLGGVKLFADGTLNSRTAWMLGPYADPLPGLERGEAMLTSDSMAATIRRTQSLGLGVAVHAIGDSAVRAVLDAAEMSGPLSKFNPATPPPVRVEHAEIIDAPDVPRFAHLGVVCSVQPCHLLADVEALRRGLPHRLDRVFPLRDLIDSGCRPGELLWFGSDTPIVRPDPEDSLQAAVRRRRPNAPPQDAIAPDQAISESEAWACFGA